MLNLFFFIFFQISLLCSQGALYTNEFVLGSSITSGDISKWIYTNALPSGGSPYPSSTCSSHNLFGGYNYFDKSTKVERTLTSLPSHFEMVFYFIVCAIDNWTNQYLNIYIDSVLVASYTFPITVPTNAIPCNTSPFAANRFSIPGQGYAVIQETHSSVYFPMNNANLCGGTTSDNCYFINIYKQHSGSSFNIKFEVTCTTIPCTGYWGLEDTIYYLSSKTISTYICSANCIYCLSGCQKCNTGYYIQDSYCVTSCSTNFVLDSVNLRCVRCFGSNYIDAGLCKPCDSSCLTCNGGSSINCLTCLSTYLYNGQCISNCNGAYYADTSTHQCLPCDSSCETCLGGLSNNCLSCYPTWTLVNSECLTTICDSTCLTCSGSLSTNCLSCIAGKYLNPTNECLIGCPPFYYKDLGNQVCKACDSSCASCSGPLSTNCISCYSTFLTNTNECVNYCLPGYYNDIASHICGTCDPICLTCSGGATNNCLSCSSNFLDTNNNECVVSCNIGFYGNIASHTCDSCDPTCYTCSGNLPTNCISCSGGRFLNSHHQCVKDCGIGYFGDNTYSTCKACDVSCSTCFGGSSNNCLSCSGTYLNNLNECNANCGSNYFKDSINYICKLCHTSCLTCSGSSTTDCLSCGATYLTNTNTCVSTCPPLFYGDSIDHQCKNCDISCASCDGPSSSNCLSCSGTLFLNNAYQCASTCPDGYYADSILFKCLNCDPSCFTCSGGLKTNCLKCNLKYFINNECLIKCPDGYYSDNANFLCKKCDATCLTCSGPLFSNCLSCSSLFLKDGRCISVCPFYTYEDSSTHTCSNCGPFCEQCDKSRCITCGPNYILQNETCVNLCPLSSYLDTNNLCKACDINCLTCFGSKENECLSCKNEEFLESGKCVKICDKSSWANILTMNCEKCIFPCIQCNSSSICLTCIDNYDLVNNNTCILRDINNLEEHNYYVYTFVSEINNPNTFLICFYSNSTNNFINITGINKIIIVLINYINDNNYFYQFKNSNHNNSCQEITFIYRDSIINEENILFIFLKIDTILNGFLFFKFNFTFPLKNKEVNIILNEYSWQYTEHPSIFLIYFKYMNIELDNFLKKNQFFDISIENFKPELDFSYNFNINLNSAYLFVDFKKIIIGDVYLKLNANIQSISFLNLNNQTYLLQANNFSIKLFQNYLLSEETESIMNQTTSVSTASTLAANILTFTDFATRPGSSIAIRGLLALDLIQLLKFIKINYPPNAMKIFKTELSKMLIKGKIINEDEDSKKLPEILTYYNINFNILNNLIDETFICVGISLLGIILEFIYSYFFKKTIVTSFIMKLFQFIYKMIVWNMVLGMLISKYFRICFFILISFRFYQDDPTSLINLILAIVYSIYIVLIFSLIFHVVSFFRYLSSTNQLEPTSPKKQTITENANPFSIEEAINFEKNKKKTIIWENFKDYETPKLRLNQRLSSRPTALNIINVNELHNQDSTKKLEESNSRQDETGTFNLEENLGSKSNNSPNASLFKTLKVSTDKKVYKLNNRKVWDVTPLTDLNKKELSAKIKDKPEIKQKLLKKFLLFIKTIIFFPCLLVTILFSSIFKKNSYNILKFSILFRDINQVAGFQNYFFCFELIRYFLLPFAVVVFFGSKTIQIILLTTFNLIYFIVILKNPFRRKIDWFLTILKEISINLTFISALGITYCDNSNNFDQNLRMNLGWIIVFCNIAVMMLIIFDSLLFLIRKTHFIISSIFKKLNNKNKITPI